MACPWFFIFKSIPTATSLQESISQMLMEYWADNLGYLLGSDNQETRFNLLKQVWSIRYYSYAWFMFVVQYQENDSEPELILLLNICDLLATCTEGECRFAEEVSRSFFPLDELLR